MMTAPSSENLVDTTGNSPEQEAARLMFTGVRHSQGSFTLEMILMKQIVECHPEWKNGGLDEGEAGGIFKKNVLEFFKGGHHAPTTLTKVDILLQIRDAKKRFANHLAGKSEPLDEGDKIDSVIYCTNRDWKYLIEKDGRPRDTPTRLRSFVCHYGLLGKRLGPSGNGTGSWEIDEYYKYLSIAALDFLKNKPDANVSRSLRDVINVHATAYPKVGPILLGMIPELDVSKSVAA